MWYHHLVPLGNTFIIHYKILKTSPNDAVRKTRQYIKNKKHVHNYILLKLYIPQVFSGTPWRVWYS